MILNNLLLNKIPRDFPDDPVVRNLLCSAEDRGLIPGHETKMPHAAGQLSP